MLEAFCFNVDNFWRMYVFRCLGLICLYTFLGFFAFSAIFYHYLISAFRLLCIRNKQNDIHQERKNYWKSAYLLNWTMSGVHTYLVGTVSELTPPYSSGDHARRVSVQYYIVTYQYRQRFRRWERTRNWWKWIYYVLYITETCKMRLIQQSSSYRNRLFTELDWRY